MKYIEIMRSYLLENDFKFNVSKNEIDIINYIEIEHFDSNKIIIKHLDGKLYITGDNLIATKLVSDEILIKGIIKNIELR